MFSVTESQSFARNSPVHILFTVFLKAVARVPTEHFFPEPGL